MDVSNFVELFVLFSTATKLSTDQGFAEIGKSVFGTYLLVNAFQHVSTLNAWLFACTKGAQVVHACGVVVLSWPRSGIKHWNPVGLLIVADKLRSSAHLRLKLGTACL